MMPKKSTFLLSVTHQSMIYGGLYLLLLRASIGPDFSCLTALWLLLPVAGTTLFLAKARKLWQFALLHLIFVFLAFVPVMGTFEQIFYLVILVLMAILHYMDSTTSNAQLRSLMPGIGGCIFHAIYYFAALWQDEPVLCTYSSCAFALSVILFLLFRFLEGRESFFLQNREIAELPEGQIYKVTRTVIILFFSVLIMGMIMVTLSGAGTMIGTLFSYLKNLLLAGLQRLFSGSVPEETMENLNTDWMTMFPSQEGSEANPIMQAIGDILFHIFLFLFGIAILAAVCMSIYRLIVHFRNELPEEKDKIEFLTPFAKSEHFHSGKEKASRAARFDFSPTAQVRKIYYKAIHERKEKKQKLSPAYTPAELERAVSLDAETLHALYEKARYSETGCDRSDLDLAKEQVKS